MGVVLGVLVALMFVVAVAATLLGGWAGSRGALREVPHERRSRALAIAGGLTAVSIAVAVLALVLFGPDGLLWLGAGAVLVAVACSFVAAVGGAIQNARCRKRREA